MMINREWKISFAVFVYLVVNTLRKDLSHMASIKEKSNQHLNAQGNGLDGLYRGVVRK